MKTKIHLAIAAAFLLVASTECLAKRMPPKPVKPVVLNGVEYSADGDGRDEYIVATELKSARVLWKQKIVHNRIMFGLEEDVQWKFITNIETEGGKLFIRDEESRCFSLEIASRKVRRQSCR